MKSIKYRRHGKLYTAQVDDTGKLSALWNNTNGVEIPKTTQSFKRLADNNRGGKFTEVADNA